MLVRRHREHRAWVLPRGSINALVIVLACASLTAHARADEGPDCIGSYCEDDAIYQFGPLGALTSSLFEGPTSYRDVLRLGDFGLGATSPLEGEVIVLDGTAYHASPSGELEILPPSARTPFAIVKHFHADRSVSLPEVGSLDELAHALDATLPSRNRFYAARIDGQFDYLQLRSVKAQVPPYPPLADVVRDQTVFEATGVDGTLVGFRFPGYLGGVNASGWHFHFVDEARHLGGHVLDVRTGPTIADLDQTRTLTLVLPEDRAFDAADLTRSADTIKGEVRSAAPRSVAQASPAPSPSPSPSPAPSPSPDDDEGEGEEAR